MLAASQQIPGRLVELKKKEIILFHNYRLKPLLERTFRFAACSVWLISTRIVLRISHIHTCAQQCISFRRFGATESEDGFFCYVPKITMLER